MAQRAASGKVWSRRRGWLHALARRGVAGFMCLLVLAGLCSLAASGRVDAGALGTFARVGTLPQGALPGQFTTEQFTDPGGARMTYYLYVPKGYSPTRSYPLVLVLHGTGERALASNSAAQNRAILLEQNYVHDWVSASAQQRWPSFVVVPQIAGPTARWVNVPGNQGTYTLAREPTTALQIAIDITVTVAAAYHGIDTHRLLIAGISMGGYGVWDAIERWPTLFAAAAPIGGAGDPHLARVLEGMPIWDFHGAADTNVPVAGSRAMYASIRAAGGSSCYTEYPGLGHDIWNTIQPYASPTFLAWFFAQTTAVRDGGHPPSCVGLVVGGVTAR